MMKIHPIKCEVKIELKKIYMYYKNGFVICFLGFVIIRPKFFENEMMSKIWVDP